MKIARITAVEVALVGGIVVVVGLGVALLRGGSDSAATPESTGGAAQASGVRGAAWDPARQEPARAADGAPDDGETPADRLGDVPPAPAQAPALAPGPADAAVPAALDPARLAESEQILALHPQVIADVNAALSAARQRLRDACYEGQPVALRVEATFDPEGRPLVLNIPDDPSNAAASACVRAELAPVSVRPPGRHVTVEVAFALP